MNIKDLNTYSLIRIHNWIENDVGYGIQIEQNNEPSLYDMMDNFDWDINTVVNFQKINTGKPFVECDFNGIVELSEQSVREICLSTINNYGTPVGELQEIIDEELALGEERHYEFILKQAGFKISCIEIDGRILRIDGEICPNKKNIEKIVELTEATDWYIDFNDYYGEIIYCMVIK